MAFNKILKSRFYLKLPTYIFFFYYYCLYGLKSRTKQSIYYLLRYFTNNAQEKTYKQNVWYVILQAS